MSWYDPRSWFRAPQPPTLSVQAYPVDINPGQRVQLARQLGRLKNLLTAVEQGDARPELQDEVRRRKGALMLMGHEPPATAAEADTLLKQLTKE